jgi:thiamine transport system substrate-binding protein
MRISIPFTLLVALLLTACGGAQATATPVPLPEPALSATPTEPRTIRLMSHDSFAISEDVISEFEADHHARV